jgi:glutaminyl-tRNA synthetase
LDHLPIKWHITVRPRQYEMARLNVTNTVMSKRKLLQLVKFEMVDGWDDPRMPTIRGLRRRGVTPEAIRSFCERIGATTTNSVTDEALLEECMREDLDRRAYRRMCVVDPVKLVIESLPLGPGQYETCTAPNHPTDTGAGLREIPLTREIYIEAADFREEAPADYFRLKPGGEVKLRYSYVVKCTGVEKDPSGRVTLIKCTHDPLTKESMPLDRKVKGVIHWVSAEVHHPACVRLYENILKRGGAEEVEDPSPTSVKSANATPEWFKDLNPESKKVYNQAVVEKVLNNPRDREDSFAPGCRFQFERVGYFVVDEQTELVKTNAKRQVSDALSKDQIVLNLTVRLKESGLKKEESKVEK